MERTSPLRSGIFGGTFDPIHLGHLRTAEEIGEELHLQRVYLIPSASPPHKTEDPVSPFHQRLAMAKLAVGDSSLLEVLDLEGKRPGPSYSIETLRELQGEFGPDHEFFFIIGTDAFLEIETWREYRQLFEYAHFAIIQRGAAHWDLENLLTTIGLGFERTGNPQEVLLPTGKTVRFKSTTHMEISSTRIRQLVGIGKSIRFLVPDAVNRYILETGLYTSDKISR
jgi:nicotinate-nucleotide adenylyltransferase